jgi:hypothetical protein
MSGTTAGGSGSTAGNTTATSQEGTNAAGISVMLNAGADVDLSAHVGHKIEVTGTMAGGRGRRGGDTGAAGGTSTAGGTAAGGTSTAAGDTGQTGRRGMMRTVNVTSVRMISTSCS